MLADLLTDMIAHEPPAAPRPVRKSAAVASPATPPTPPTPAPRPPPERPRPPIRDRGPVVDGATIRAKMIAAGVLRPGAGPARDEPTPERQRDLPTIRHDARALRVVAYERARREAPPTLAPASPRSP
jgi:hypothetical protein